MKDWLGVLDDGVGGFDGVAVLAVFFAVGFEPFG